MSEWYKPTAIHVNGCWFIPFRQELMVFIFRTLKGKRKLERKQS